MALLIAARPYKSKVLGGCLEWLRPITGLRIASSNPLNSRTRDRLWLADAAGVIDPLDYEQDRYCTGHACRVVCGGAALYAFLVAPLRWHVGVSGLISVV